MKVTWRVQVIPGMRKHVRVKFRYWHLLRGFHCKLSPGGKVRERGIQWESEAESEGRKRRQLQVQNKQ